MPSSRREILDGRELIGDENAPYGSLDWLRYLRRHTITTKRDVSSLAFHLKADLASLRKEERWQALTDLEGRPFTSWDDFCQYPEPFGLGMRMTDVVAILAETDPTRTLRQVLSHAEAGKLGGRGKKAPDHGKELTSHGNGRDYIEGRLRKAGRHDLADQVAADEITSYAAAVAMGWRAKPDNSLGAAWDRASKEEQDALLARIGAVLVT